MKDQIRKDVRVSIKRVHFMEGFLSSHIQYELRYLCVSKIYTYQNCCSDSSSMVTKNTRWEFSKVWKEKELDFSRHIIFALCFHCGTFFSR